VVARSVDKKTASASSFHGAAAVAAGLGHGRQHNKTRKQEKLSKRTGNYTEKARQEQ